MATYPLFSPPETVNVVHPREYVVFRSPELAEARAVAVSVPGAVRPFGAESRTSLLEEQFTARTGVAYAVATASREAALRLAMRALGLGTGDDVVVPAVAPMPTANAVLQAGATPAVCDVDAGTHIPHPDDVDRVRTKRTRALIVTHLGGRAADLTALGAYAREIGAFLINDAGLAVDAQHAGRSIAQFGTLSIYGSDPARQNGTREGGIILTDDPVLAGRLAALRANRTDAAEEAPVRTAGADLRMSASQASEGLRFLENIDAVNRRRRMIWNRYDEALAGQPVLRPVPVTPGDRHGLCDYTVMVTAESCAGGRDALALALHHARIGTAVHYRGVHLHPRFRDALGYTPEDLPVASRISNQTLSLPISAVMTDRDVEYVIATLTNILDTPR